MKRIILCIWLVFAILTPIFAAEESSGEDKTMVWKWANFAILAGALGYVIAKKGGAFFAARNAEIQKNIAESHKLKEEADAQLAEIDKRLAGLEADIRAVREEARQEMTAEAERVHRELMQELAKIQAQAEMEIEAAGRSARLNLKIYAGELAIELARRKILARLSPSAQDTLVHQFVNGLQHDEAERRAAI